MKKFLSAVVCCALIVANVSAQEGASIVESPVVALASAQEPVAPEAQKSATDVAAPAAAAQATAPAVQVVEGVPATPIMAGSDCGCGGSVVSFAAPAAPAMSGCCQAAAPACCPPSRGLNISRPYIIRNLSGRLTSIGGRGNNCCN